MKKIFAIAWKDAIVRFGSVSELLFFIVLPIVFTFLLAGGTPSGDEDPRVVLMVADEANSAISQQMIGELEISTTVRPEVVSRAEAQSLFDDRRADVAALVGERSHRHAPPAVQRTEQGVRGDADVGEEHLVELGLAGHLAQRANIDAR